MWFRFEHHWRRGRRCDVRYGAPYSLETAFWSQEVVAAARPQGTQLAAVLEVREATAAQQVRVDRLR